MNGVIPLSSVVWAVSVVSMAGGAEPAAVVRGGADVTGQVYTWVITNRRDSPLIYVSFPHYRGGAFVAPDGWDTSESTYLVGVGVEDRPGVCVARAPSASDGIRVGRSAEFRLQLAAGGARHVQGEMTLHFADGSEAVIPEVELPYREAVGDQFVTLLGLGAIFGGWLLLRYVRSRASVRANTGSGG